MFARNILTDLRHHQRNRIKGVLMSRRLNRLRSSARALVCDIPLPFDPLSSCSSIASTYASMSSPNSSPTLSPSSTPPDSPVSSLRTLSPTPTVLEPSFFVFPDLLSHCPFSLTYHDDGDAIAADSLEWIMSYLPHFTQNKVAALRGLQAGELTAYCFNNCASDHLRVVSDFMNFLFHLDDVSDGHLARDAEGLGNCVMNAFEWPDDYRPVRGQLGGIQIQENSAAKLAREYVSSFLTHSPPRLISSRFWLCLQLLVALYSRLCPGGPTTVQVTHAYVFRSRAPASALPCE
jgi:hypothetical protein